jgi:hypothetical protein
MLILYKLQDSTGGGVYDSEKKFFPLFSRFFPAKVTEKYEKLLKATRRYKKLKPCNYKGYRHGSFAVTGL